MRFFISLVVWGSLAAQQAIASDNACLTEQAKIDEAISGYTLVQDVKSEIVDKWVSFGGNIFDFANDGAVYMKMAGAIDEEGRKRWKGSYTFERDEDNNHTLCFPVDLSVSVKKQCGLLLESNAEEMSFSLKIAFPCENETGNGYEISGLTISERGTIFGVPHPAGKDSIRQGDFQNILPVMNSGEKIAADGDYESISVIDLKLDIGRLLNHKISVHGKVGVFGDDAYLSDPDQEADYSQITVDIDTLSRRDRKYILQNCQDDCEITVNGVVIPDDIGGQKIAAESIQY